MDPTTQSSSALTMGAALVAAYDTRVDVTQGGTVTP